MSQALEKQIKKLEDLKKSRRNTFSRVQRKKLESLKKKLAQSKKPTLGDVGDTGSSRVKGTSFLRDLAIKKKDREKAAKAKKKPLGRSPGAMGGKAKPKTKKPVVIEGAKRSIRKGMSPGAMGGKAKPKTTKVKPTTTKAKPTTKKPVAFEGTKRSIRKGMSPGAMGGKAKPTTTKVKPTTTKAKPTTTKPTVKKKPYKAPGMSPGAMGGKAKPTDKKPVAFEGTKRSIRKGMSPGAMGGKAKPTTTKAKPKVKKAMTQAELNQFKQARVKPKAKKSMTQAELNQFKQARVKPAAKVKDPVKKKVKVTSKPKVKRPAISKLPGRKPPITGKPKIDPSAGMLAPDVPKVFKDTKAKPKTFEDKLRDKFIKGRGGRDAFKSDKQIDSAFESELMEMREGADAGFSYQDQKDYEKVMDERAAKRKSGGQVKRKYGGKVKRNSGGKVFRRGGGQALRGFGKATYSNKMY